MPIQNIQLKALVVGIHVTFRCFIDDDVIQRIKGGLRENMKIILGGHLIIC